MNEAAFARIRNFSATEGHPGALVNIDLRGTGFPLLPETPFTRWQFPRDLHAYLDEQVRCLLKAWSAKESLDDDSVPCLYPRFGIAEHSAFVGGEVTFSSDTSYPHPCIDDWSDVDRLELREDNPWLRMVLDGMEYLNEQAAGRFVVALRGAMSPLDLALALRGNDLYSDFYEEPEEVHRLVRFCTDACRFFMEQQLRTLPDLKGGVMTGCFVWMPGHSFGHFSEDASVLCSPAHYREFGRPYTVKLLEPLEHAFMHLHSAGAHAFPDVLSIPNIDFIELANDPGKPRGIEILRQQPDLFARKTVKLFVSPDEIRTHVNLLRGVRTLLFCAVETPAEGRAILEFVRRELPLART